MRSSTIRLLLKGAVGYVLLVSAGWFGAHRLFLGRPKSAAALAACLIGGALIGSQLSDAVGSVLFYTGIAWLIVDFLRLPWLVAASGPAFPWDKQLAYAGSERAVAESAPALEPPSRAIGEALTLDQKIDKAAGLAGSEATAEALRRFAEVRHRLSGQIFDTDLAGEVEAIDRRHFGALLTEYVQSRPYCSESDGAEEDIAVRDAADRLTARLTELSQVQAARDLGDIRTIEHYLRERHPIARDDPLGSSASGR
jgi:TM2 domain-containing membrane protein YozV